MNLADILNIAKPSKKSCPIIIPESDLVRIMKEQGKTDEEIKKFLESEEGYL